MVIWICINCHGRSKNKFFDFTGCNAFKIDKVPFILTSESSDTGSWSSNCTFAARWNIISISSSWIILATFVLSLISPNINFTLPDKLALPL